MASLRLFVCFDAGHDDDLRALFERQCTALGSTFRVVDRSRADTPHAGWEDKLRGRFDGVDAVVVLCGEDTHEAANVSREFGIAQEKEMPYVLLWGRRSGTCTRPATARVNDHLYTWSWSVLAEQIHLAIRHKLDPLGIERATLLGLRRQKT
jgi:hypothetical protein